MARRHRHINITDLCEYSRTHTVTLHFSINGQLTDEVFVIDEVTVLVSQCCQHLIHLLLAEWLTCFSDTTKVIGDKTFI